MNKDKFEYIGRLLIVIALTSFANGYLNANSASPVWSGVFAVILSPFIIALPSLFVAGFIHILLSFVSGGFELDAPSNDISDQSFQALHWISAIGLVLFLDLGM